MTVTSTSAAGLGVQPRVLLAHALTSTRVRVVFSETMSSAGVLLVAGSYVLTPSGGADARTVTSVEIFGDSPSDSVVLSLDGHLTPGDDNYTVTVDNTVQDAAGNSLDPAFDEAIFGGVPGVVIEDWCDEGQSWILSPFYKQPKINRLLCIFLDQFQEIEQMFADLRELRSLATAGGVHLVHIGQRLGLEKFTDVTDDEYRLALYGKAKANHSKASTPEMIEVLRIMLNGGAHHVLISFPLSIRFIAEDPLSYEMGRMFARVLATARPAAVNHALIYEPAGRDIICFDDDTSRPIIGWAEEGGGGLYSGVLAEEDPGRV